MTILQILVAPDPRLKQKAQPVETVDETVHKLMEDMLETMYAAPGIGLAATQVGVARQVIVVDVANRKEGEAPNPIRLANPEVVWRSEEEAVCEEGCLSVPDFYEEVSRPAKCRVTGLNEKGEAVEIEAEGLLATCLQHEIDHLDGTLFVDHLGRVKRELILKKLKKAKKSGKFDQPHPQPGHVSI